MHSSKTLSTNWLAVGSMQKQPPLGGVFWIPTPNFRQVEPDPPTCLVSNSQKRRPSFWMFSDLLTFEVFHLVLESLVNSSDFSWKSRGNWNDDHFNKSFKIQHQKKNIRNKGLNWSIDPCPYLSTQRIRIHHQNRATIHGAGDNQRVHQTLPRDRSPATEDFFESSFRFVFF